MPHLATDRISRGLRWAGTGLLVAGAALIVVGIGWTRSPDALITISAIAALAFGLPGAAAFGLAFWLEHTADQLERGEADDVVHTYSALAPPERNPFREPLRRYAIAIVAVALAWAARGALDHFIPNQAPFVTFFLAVAVAGWLGGFGPAALATLLSLIIAWRFYVAAVIDAPVPELGRFVLLGLFVFVCLGIAAITAALHAALERTQQLAEELRRQKNELTATAARASAPGDSDPLSS